MIIEAARTAPARNSTRPASTRRLVSVEALLDFHLRRARLMVHTVRYKTWSVAQPSDRVAPWDRHTRADVALTLQWVASERRIVAALLALRRAGVEQLTDTRWATTRFTVANQPTPPRSLQVVAWGEGVMRDLDGLRVGTLWCDRSGAWFAVRRGRNDNTPAGWMIAGDYETAESAAYAVGCLITDH
ncbi:hypothetical protein KBX50_08295 [Micromonospora sp. C51]|uniref:hypothetical protein n=1 Tax=Micromonospora sp. C51 TaxID=2824879 RepID=UPI001B3686ED|nr:hypothetical protein [Micromonospora sp. C51]MBQ1048464.1 hypothetical protein [Micromonospora sp. C51]